MRELSYHYFQEASFESLSQGYLSSQGYSHG